MAGTGWAAFSAITEFANYQRTTRGQDPETKQAHRFESVLFGSGADFVARGADALQGMLRAA